MVAAASTAVAANLGLLGTEAPDADPVGNLDAANVAELVADTTTTSVGDPVVVYVDEYVTVPAAPASPSSPSAPGGSAPVVSGSAPLSSASSPAVSGAPAATAPPAVAPVGGSYDDDDYDDEHEDEHEEEHEEEHEDEDEHEEDHEDD